MSALKTIKKFEKSVIPKYQNTKIPKYQNTKIPKYHLFSHLVNKKSFDYERHCKSFSSSLSPLFLSLFPFLFVNRLFLSFCALESSPTPTLPSQDNNEEALNFTPVIIANNISKNAVLEFKSDAVANIIFTVTFDVDKESSVDVIDNVPHNTKIDKPTNQTKANHTFENWYKDNEKTKVFNFNLETITVNFTLHTKWKQEIYIETIKYNYGYAPDGGRAESNQDGKV